MNIVVTGGNGFLGRFVVRELQNRGYDGVYTFGRKEFDLVDFDSAVRMYKTYSPDVVVHLAAEVGGIGANMVNSGRFFYSNMSMGLNLVENARNFNVKKFVFVSTVCSYPKFTPSPFKERDIWNGYPEETNAPYGIAKKAVMTMLQGYKSQYGLNGAVLVPTNLYGPFDNFNPNSSHVIPALIKKFYEAKTRGQRVVKCWGDGSATREFLYVSDAARGIVEAIEKINDPEPINLGSGYEISIKNLAEKVGRFVGYEGDIEWDISKPNGQPRRCLDVTKAKTLLNWEAWTDFDQGLSDTISYYRSIC